MSRKLPHPHARSRKLSALERMALWRISFQLSGMAANCARKICQRQPAFVQVFVRAKNGANPDTAPDCEAAGARLCRPRPAAARWKTPEHNPSARYPVWSRCCGWSATQPRSGGRMRPQKNGPSPQRETARVIHQRINPPARCPAVSRCLRPGAEWTALPSSASRGA